MEALLLEHDLSSACLGDAVVTPEQLRRTGHLNKMEMPDGNTYEEWLGNGEPDWSIHGMPDVWTAHTSR